jgi:hypothetical protein
MTLDIKILLLLHDISLVVLDGDKYLDTKSMKPACSVWSSSASKLFFSFADAELAILLSPELEGPHCMVDGSCRSVFDVCWGSL